MKFAIIILLFFGFISNSLKATTYYVNDNSLVNDIYTTAIGNNANTGLTPADPFADLATAISMVVSGDVILVDAGNYAGINLVLPAGLNNITITGASVSTTIFDGTLGSGIFLFMTIRGDDILIENLTITEYDNAGAIDIISGSASDSTDVRFNNCYFYRNETFASFSATPQGGAVYIATGAGNLPAVVSFYHCQLGDNLSEQSAGGGAIYIEGRSRLYMYGSRMTCNNSRAILTTYEGGTILFQNAYGELDSCYISGSQVINQQGGAIRGINSTARLTINLKNTIFTENTGRQGAAVFMEDNLNCNFINCLVYANTVTGGFGDGGSINCLGAVNMSIVNSTIADNLSSHASDGGGLANEGSGTYNVFNSIIWNNQVSNIRTANITATYSDIEPVNANHSGTTGNIFTDPLFVGGNDYTLQISSPCINAGDVIGAPTNDLTNFTRVGNPDMGAFESGATIPSTSTICTLFLICNPPTVLALTADNLNICDGTSTNITIANSENGVYYQLVNDLTSSNVGSPVIGNGGTISFSTGNLNADTDFSVTAYEPTFPSCTSTLGPISINVAPNVTPTFSFGTSSTVCSNGSVPTLPTTSSNGITGTWSPSSVSSTTSNTYTFTPTAGLCATTSTFTQTINPLPLVTVSSNAICEDGSLTLTPTTGGTWTSNNTSVATVTPAGIVTIVADGTVDFTFEESTNNCTATTSSVTVNPLPVVSVVSPLIVSCNIPIVTLDGTGSDQGIEFTYLWTTSNGVIIGDTDLDTAATSDFGTYNLLVTNTNNGCTSNADVSVTMDTVSPIADAGVDVNFPCGVTTVGLDGSASSGTGITYNWTGPTTISNGTTATPDVNGAGQYTLTVTASNGCSDTDVVDVIPDVNAPVANAGSAIVVTCINPLPVVLDGSGSDSGTDITYSWTATLGGNITADGTTTTPTVDQAGTYEILVTNTSNNCTATSTVTVTTDTISPVADAGVSSLIICDNSTAVLDGATSTGSNLTYNWTTSNGTIDSQTGAEATVSDAGDYELTVTGDNGCSDVTTLTVSLATPITETTAPTVTISDCGIDNGSITGIVVNGDPTLTYSWENATGTEIGTSADIANLGVGDYTLVVTDGNGCDATFGPYSITNPNAPIANVPTITQPDCDNATGSISVGGVFDTYELTGTNPVVTTVTNTTGDFTNLNPGVYEIVVVDASCNSLPASFTINNPLDLDCDGDGVTDGDEIADGTDPNDPCDFVGSSITLGVTTTVSCDVGIFIPDGFSPNGDNTNDTFVIENIENYPNNIFSVFNRWGNIVYEEAGYLNTWDGTSQAKIKIGGEDLPTGTYFFILDLGEDVTNIERIYKGFIYLNR